MPKPIRPPALAAALAAAGLIAFAAPAQAWVYPEHRDIAVLAVEKLDPERKAQFDRLWGEARTGNEQRLCAQGADSQQGVAPGLHRLGGVHGHRRRPLVLEQQHARQHAQHRLDPPGRRRGGAAEGRSLAARRRGAAGCEAVRAERPRRLPAPGRGRDAARPPHQRAAHLRHAPATRRPAYATRAGSNNAHFLLPRPSTDTTPREYAELSLRPGLRPQRRRRLRLVPHERAAEGVTAGQRVARARRAPRAGAGDAGRRGIRAPLPRGHLRGRPRRGHLGRRVAAQGHARSLQRVRPRGLHLGRRQRVGGPDGRRAHARRGHRARRGRRPRQPRAGDRPGQRSARRGAAAAHPGGPARARHVRHLQEQRARPPR